MIQSCAGDGPVLEADSLKGEVGTVCISLLGLLRYGVGD